MNQSQLEGDLRQWTGIDLFKYFILLIIRGQDREGIKLLQRLKNCPHSPCSKHNSCSSCNIIIWSLDIECQLIQNIYLLFTGNIGHGSK